MGFAWWASYYFTEEASMSARRVLTPHFMNNSEILLNVPMLPAILLCPASAYILRACAPLRLLAAYDDMLL